MSTRYMTPRFYVLCLDDSPASGGRGRLTMATSRPFATREAAERYAETVAPSREPFVVGTLNALTTK